MLDRLTKHEQFTIAILFYVNIINYMDRYAIAGILADIQEEFNIGDDFGGLLQTAFLISYIIFAPIFGYLGDRYSRRCILVYSVLIWVIATLAGSFARTYGWFFFMRTFVGIGEASFSAIAPTIIYDVTYKSIRKNILALFYIAIPIGAGLGFVISAKTAGIGGHWSWGMRVTPVMASIGIVLLCFIKDPIRGERERLETGKRLYIRTTSYKKDLISLSKNRSYILSTLGFTCVTFVTGALSWWGPKFFHSGFRLIPGEENITLEEVATGVGIMAVLSGLIGVPLGVVVAQKLNQRYPACDPIICGVGLLAGDPFAITGLVISNKSIRNTYIVAVIGVVLMNVTWTLTSDILLSVVVPETRSTAEAIQIAISHTFGDAGSPYLVGLLSEVFKTSWKRNHPFDDSNMKLINQFEAMRTALYCIGFTQLLGGILFLSCALYIVADREAVLEAIANASTRASLD